MGTWKRETRGAIGITATVLVVVTLVLLYLVGIGALSLVAVAPWTANKQTEVLRNTNQYVQTQQSRINGLLVQHARTDDPKAQELLVEQMCDAASRIDPVYVPVRAKALMMQAGCWSAN